MPESAAAVVAAIVLGIMGAFFADKTTKQYRPVREKNEADAVM